MLERNTSFHFVFRGERGNRERRLLGIEMQLAAPTIVLERQGEHSFQPE
jgi:hypothetical protein